VLRPLRYLTDQRTAGWLMGMDWPVAWLERFGIWVRARRKDIERLDDLAGPRWGRRKLFGILRPSMLG
jgi:hypothetical protein